MTEKTMPTNEVTAKAKILVHSPRDEVFNAFIDPSIMSKFWFKRRDQGLREGETISWLVGDAADALEIEVRVQSTTPPSQIIVDWGHGEQFTNVTWTLDEQGSDMTCLTIEECGFTGLPDEIVAQALDSTGGFNQVVIALKALLEHDVVINVVADHP